MRERNSYWKTVDYIGGGYVLQRKYDKRGDLVKEMKVGDEWTEYKNSGDRHRATRIKERIVHATETDIDINVVSEVLSDG